MQLSLRFRDGGGVINKRAHTMSIRDAGSLDTAQWNFVSESDPIDAVPGEGGVDIPEPHLRGVGVVLTQ